MFKYQQEAGIPEGACNFHLRITGQATAAFSLTVFDRVLFHRFYPSSLAFSSMTIGGLRTAGDVEDITKVFITLGTSLKVAG